MIKICENFSNSDFRLVLCIKLPKPLGNKNKCVLIFYKCSLFSISGDIFTFINTRINRQFLKIDH